MRKAVVILLALAGPVLSQERQPRTLSLEEALGTARTNQPQLRQARAATEAARARVDQTRAPLLPQVSSTASFQRTTSNFVARPGTLPSSLSQGSRSASFDTFGFYNAGLSASQLVYDFGQTTGRWRAAEAGAEAQADTERATRLQIDLDARTAYFDARAAKALVMVAQETLANQNRHLTQVQGFVEVGRRPEIDLAQVRTDLANARVLLINSENAYDTARARLNQVMGIEAPTDYDIADETLPVVSGEDQPLDELLDEALRARPELAALSSQVRAQEQTLRSIKGAYGPSVNLSTGLSEAGSEIDDLVWNWNAGLLLSWPVFQGGQTRAQVRVARAELAGLEAQVDALRQGVRLEVDQARLAVRAAVAALGAADDAVLNAREGLRLAEGRYETGVGNMIELGDAQLALTNAEAQSVQAEYSLASARARLLKALGRP